MIVKCLFWLLLVYLVVSVPVVVSWYAPRARRLLQGIRAAAGQLKVRLRAALGRRLRRLLTEDAGSTGDEDSPSAAPLRPLP